MNTPDKDNIRIDVPLWQRTQMLNLERGVHRQKLNKLLSTNSNASTFNGMANLAAQVQHDLYLTDGLTRGDMGRLISNANVEMGARVIATTLDRVRITPSYEAGNITAWLGSKGLEAVATTKEDVVWEQGRLTNKSGKREESFYFPDIDMNPGAHIVILDHLATKCAENAASTDQVTENDSKVLNLVSAVASTLSMEIESIATDGKPLQKEQYFSQLEEPLKALGIELKDKEA